MLKIPQARTIVGTHQALSNAAAFVASGYPSSHGLHRLGLIATLLFLAVFMLIGAAWILVVI